MHSQALRFIHRQALRSRHFEQRLATNPRAVLQMEGVPEQEIRLIEEYAPQNVLAFGLVIRAVDKVLYGIQDDAELLN